MLVETLVKFIPLCSEKFITSLPKQHEARGIRHRSVASDLIPGRLGYQSDIRTKNEAFLKS